MIRSEYYLDLSYIVNRLGVNIFAVNILGVNTMRIIYFIIIFFRYFFQYGKYLNKQNRKIYYNNKTNH